MKMQEIAARINEHLKRFERDPKINAWHGGKVGGTRPYYFAGAGYPGGSRIFVVYVSYQGHSHLTKQEAIDYLAWLDAGNVGRHHDQQRETGRRR